MKIFWDIAAITQQIASPIVALGNFDGVHAGHQALFRLIHQRAKEIQGTSCVITFDPHPQKVLFPDQELYLLNHLEEKFEIIQAHGIDLLLCLPFTPEFAAQDPIQFVKDVLVEKLHVREMYIGYDGRFGHGRNGSPEVLAELGEKYGFRVTIIPPIVLDGTVVSSTKIRQFLQNGEVERAAALLNRPYALDGTVVYGTQRGSQLLGFPTANVDVIHELIPKRGVYVCQVHWKQQTFQAVVNIGINPTFPNSPLTVEAHLLDFDGNLYGEWIQVLFLKRLRDETTFPTPQALAAQISADVETARQYFSSQ
ncbi:riboflavin kinase / FMN adenylyltransferase [Candidatus Moduliflexus flocculans]|uniref:Riboflavin biosynthesis protein n=1 Tax=Candidatus Moduliflexus flocculans TaxID=1499966 RepID=A0A081BQN3_9BACT|nr:riboflavin kinase / FMN adenylyltransferase [Candidatus Moduliflexus flocculans]